MSLPARGFRTALALVFLIAGPASAAPKVVASIRPVHSLVAGVMQGLGTPVLLVGGGSPHGYSLRPSEAHALNEADLVFWVGGGLESFLAKPLAALVGHRARVLALAEAPGMRLLTVRRGGPWDVQEETAPHGDDAAGHSASGSVDFHIWLDPQNAVAIVNAAVTALARADPENATRYRHNGDQAIARIEALDREIAERLAPVRERPYMVFHDAYQYFERHYGLHAAGAIAVNPDRPPGARRLSAIRAKIAAVGAVCVFTEPQFRPALVDTVIAGSAARSAVLDPLGSALPAGPETYYALMRGLAASLVGCLSPGG